MSGIVGSKLNIRGSGRIAKLGTDGQVLTSSGAGEPANYEDGATTYDDDAVRDDIATLALHQATNANAAKYNLVNTNVDQYEDSTGVSAFTDCARDDDEYVSTVADGTQVNFTATGTWTRGSAAKAKILIVAGGGGGGYDAGGAGGAGGLVYVSGYAVTGTSYTVTIGTGGAGDTGPGGTGASGVDTTFAGDTTLTAKGGGGGGSTSASAGLDGGSGGGSGGAHTADKGDATQGSQAGDSGTYGYGFDGIEGASGSPGKGGGGGGGAGAAPTAIWNTTTGSAGGAGKDMTTPFGTGVGESGWFAGGGGGGNETAGTTSPGGQGGGGDGGGPATGSPDATDGTANTGGGGGGGKNPGGAGGSGFASVIPEATNATGNYISNDSTANASVSSMGIVMTYKNASGTNTLNTDIIAEVSANGGTNYTTAVLTAGGTFSTGILQAIANDISVTAGTAVRYRISFANQAAGSKIAQIYGVSLMY